MIEFFVLSVYLILKGLKMIYEPLFYIGSGLLSFTAAKVAWLELKDD